MHDLSWMIHNGEGILDLVVPTMHNARKQLVSSSMRHTDLNGITYHVSHTIHERPSSE